MLVRETKLYHGTKSDILKQFEASQRPTFESMVEKAIVIDLSFIIKAKAASPCSTFNEFASIVFQHIMELAKQYNRCDIVAGRYFQGSLKEGTRDKRGSKGSKLLFDGDTVFPKDFAKSFLSNSHNKNRLNLFLAEKFIKLHENTTQVLVVTFNETILSTDKKRIDRGVNKLL